MERMEVRKERCGKETQMCEKRGGGIGVNSAGEIGMGMLVHCPINLAFSITML